VQPDAAPYPGLRSFKSTESDIFFGRDECIDAMLSRLAATRFLAVLGSSGIGKSSLVKTGLLSALQMGMLRGAGSSWLVIDFRPGQPEGSPLRNLVRGLLESAAQPATPEAIARMQAQFIQDGPRALLKWCLEGHLPADTNLLLLVDQFEELFRYQDYSSREEAEAFVALLLESRRPLEAKCPQMAELPIYVTLTMRSEFLGACSLIQNLPEAITEGAFLTPRMTREQYREAIVGPAEVCGVKIEDTLVNRVLNDLAAFAPWDEKEPEAQNSSAHVDATEAQDQLVRLARRADQLPVLQHALNRIWRRAYERGEAERKAGGVAVAAPIELTLEDYKAIGGLENALNAHADAVLDSVSKTLGGDVERAAERLFRALVIGSTPSDAVRWPTPLGDLNAITNDERGVRAIVEAFRADECNFLIPEAAIPLVPAVVIDISHESLIRQWKRLSEWVAREAIAAQRWRRLNDRFNQREPLRGRVLENLVAWREETLPNAAWAKRYGGDYAAVIAFLDKSERSERNRRLVRNGAIVTALVGLCMVSGMMFALWQQALTANAHAVGNYEIAKDVLRSLTFNFAGNMGSGGQNQEMHTEHAFQKAQAMQITELTDAFQKTQASLDELAKANPNDVELLGIQADILDKFVDGYQATGYKQLGLDVANEENAVLHRLIKLDPDNVRWQTLLASNLKKSGDLKVSLNDSIGARESYLEALSLDRALMQREPGNEDHQRQAAIELFGIGGLQSQANDGKAALQSYQQALAIQKELADLYSVLPDYRRDYSWTLGEIANLQNNTGDRRDALAAYQQKLEIDQQIIKLPFGVWDTDHTRISIDLRAIAALQEQLGDDAGALKSYDESLQFDRAYADQHPDNSGLQQRVAETGNAIGMLQLKADQAEAAKKTFAIALAAELLVAQATRVAALSDSSKVRNQLDPYGQVAWYSLLESNPQQAVNYAQAALGIDSSQAWIDVKLAHAYLFLGRYDDAKTIYLKVKDQPDSPTGKRTFADDIHDDFITFRKLGIAPADLDRVEREVGI
jgi:tetratricopeptide (TPR) repeat protein